jgi:hypothetical protein
MQKFKLIICVYGCITIGKYKEQINKINQTWGSNLNNSVKILYFLGQEKNNEFNGDQYIYLPNVTNDYLSASYKQFLGLKYIYENYDAEFIICCGTDTFINIPKLLLFINKFNSNDNLYIGGHGCNRTIGDKTYYFHSGGPGFLITKKCLQKLHPFLHDLMEKWINICSSNNVTYLTTACDVAISYFIQNYINSDIIRIDDYSFTNCNHKGMPCHPNMVDKKNIISCHNMNPSDFDEFYNILKSNNFFV